MTRQNVKMLVLILCMESGWFLWYQCCCKAFCKPRIKVGIEWVTKGQTCEQATGAVGGIGRAIFDRIFKWLIEKCNDTLIDPTLKKANFRAVLDIAGFEIFEASIYYMYTGCN